MKKLIISILISMFFTGVAQGKTNGNVNKSSLEDVKTIFNDTNCDVIFLDYFTTCYSYKRKSPVAVYTEVEGTKVAGDGIDKRPSFYTDQRLPEEYAVNTEDYTNTGYDRGHFGASDASFDWSQESLESTYKMSNIVPQTPRANRYKFVSLEKLEREMAVKYGVLETLTIAYWNDRPSKIGKSQQHVPSAFAKVFSAEEYRECFFVWNNDEYDSKTGKDPYSYKTDCDKVFELVGTTVGKAEGFTATDKVELLNLLDKFKSEDLNKTEIKSIDKVINLLR